jgi:hypothetical protein
VFAFNQSYRAANDSKGYKIVLRGRLDEDLQNVACSLIEGFDRGQDVSVGQGLRLAEDTFRTGLIDIEAENLTAKSAMHDNAAGARREVRLRFIGLANTGD